MVEAGAGKESGSRATAGAGTEAAEGEGNGKGASEWLSFKKKRLKFDLEENEIYFRAAN